MYVINSNAQSNTSVTIHRVSASNIEVFTFEVDIGVDSRLRIISFVYPNRTNDVILELVVTSSDLPRRVQTFDNCM